MKALTPLIVRRLLSQAFSLSSSAPRGVSGLAAAWMATAKPVAVDGGIDPCAILYRRITPASKEPSIAPVLDQWVNEGRPVTKHMLLSIAKSLRKYTRFNHALEVLHWMSDRRSMNLSAGEMAIQMDLISKVHGVKQAEEFFYKIPEKQRRNVEIYSTLLNCYMKEVLVDKAEALWLEMRGLGFSRSVLAYGSMFNLYYRSGDCVKLNSMVQEMEREGLIPDRFVYGSLLSAYGSVSDVDGMKKIIDNAESDHRCKLDPGFYTSAANWYLKAGLLDKVVECLKKAEKLLAFKNKKDVTLHYLLTLYAAVGRKADVWRIWDMCKSYKVYNRDYMCIIQSLLKLDDLESAERILVEWESSDLALDMHVPNVLIAAYCRKDLVEKAECVVNRQVLRGLEPDSFTRLLLSEAYIRKKRMPEAVEAIKSAVEVSKAKWKPTVESLAACFSYLIAEKDMEAFEELVGLLRSKGFVSEELHRKLLVLASNGDEVKDALEEGLSASVEES